MALLSLKATIILVSVYFCCKNTILLFYFEFSTMKNYQFNLYRVLQNYYFTLFYCKF